MKKKIKEVEEIEEDVDDMEEEAPAPRERVKKKKEEIWTMANMPTQHVPVAYNKETEESLDTIGALVKILNEIEDLKKLIG